MIISRRKRCSKILPPIESCRTLCKQRLSSCAGGRPWVKGLRSRMAEGSFQVTGGVRPPDHTGEELRIRLSPSDQTWSQTIQALSAANPGPVLKGRRNARAEVVRQQARRDESADQARQPAAVAI